MRIVIASEAKQSFEELRQIASSQKTLLAMTVLKEIESFCHKVILSIASMQFSES